MPTIVEQRPFSIDEAADFLHLKKSYLYRLCGLGKISYSKPGGGRILFTREDLDAFVAQGRRPATFELHQQAEQIALRAARK